MAARPSYSLIDCDSKRRRVGTYAALRAPRRCYAEIALRHDISAQSLDLELDLVQTLLHHVADADDSQKRAILDDGQVPDALVGHHLADLDQRVAGRAHPDLAAHQLLSRKRQHTGRMFRDAPDDVAFGNDADHAPVLFQNRYGTDPVLTQHVGDSSNRFQRAHGDDAVAFMLQDLRYGRFHGAAPHSSYRVRSHWRIGPVSVLDGPKDKVGRLSGSSRYLHPRITFGESGTVRRR